MKINRILAVIFVAAFLLFAMPILAHAADWGEGDTLEDALSQLKVGFYDTQLDWLQLPNFGVVKQRYTYFYFANVRTGQVEERPVYCVDPTRGGAHEIVAALGNNTDGSKTATYIRGEKVGDAKYKGILAAGYPHMQLTSLGLQTKEEAYYATKLALWMYIRGNDPTKLTINPAYGDSNPVAQRVRAAAVQIYTNGTTGSFFREPSLTLTGKPSTTANLDSSGEYYVQGVEVYASGWIGENPSASGDVLLSWESPPPAGTIVLGTNGEDITSTLAVKMNAVENVGRFGNITIKYPAAIVDPDTFSPPTLKAEALLPNDEIYTAYAQAGKDTYQRYLVERDAKIILTASFVSQVNIEPGDIDFPTDTGLRIRKLEAGTNIPLGGAVFEIRDPEGRLVYSMATPDNGIIDIPLAVMGNYTITETTPPRYHLLPEQRTQSVTVKYGEVAEVTFVNAPYGTLRVAKRDAADGRPLGGAAIQIRNITTNTTQEGRTDSSGNVVFEKLPVGAYEILEQASPDGYALNSTPHTVNVVPLSEGETSYTLTNKANPGLRIIKFDRQTMMPIDGVTFEIWHDGELYGEYVTDNWGEIELRNLPAGTWTVKEIATREPYVLDSTVQWVELRDGQGYISELVFLNLIKPGMQLIKLDSQTMQPLPGAVFRIEQVAGSFLQEYTTDANGEIDLSALEPSAYQVIELSAPDGFLIDNASRTIQLNAGESGQFVFTNTKKPSLTIIKTDTQTGQPLSGARFEVKVADGQALPGSPYTTDSEGKIHLPLLDVAKLEITEISAPQGFVANQASQIVTLSPGKDSVVSFTNTRKPNLTIRKLDSITGDPVKGAKFQIWYAENGSLTGNLREIGVFYTDGSGEILLPKQEVGWYRVQELEPASGYGLKAPSTQDVFLEAGKDKTLTFENIPLSALVIRKIDNETSLPVAGAGFRVRYLGGTSGSGGTIIYEGVTSTNGTIVLTGLAAGTYIAEEYRPAPGYELANPASQTAYLSGLEQDVVELVFTNAHMGGLVIKKLDSVTKQPIKGVTFKVTDSSGAVIGPTNGEYVTDAEGLINIAENLSIGSTVIIQEISCPDAYIIDTTEQSIKIQENTLHAVTFYNTPKSNLIIKKYNSETKQPLAGATFLVTDSQGAVIGSKNGEYTTDASGVINLGEYLTPGMTVVAKEIRCPDGYLLDSTPQTVKITENTLHELSFYNTPLGGLLIKKYDSVTKQPLSGAVFKVTESNGAVVGNGNGQYTTDKDGSILIPRLKPGSYIAYEERQPSGYLLDSTPQTIIIPDEKLYTLTFLNVPQPGLQILKLDESTRRPIPGVEFAVSEMNGKQIGTYRTDSQGLITLPELPTGWYTATETKSASGYLLDTTPHNIELKAGESATLTVTNSKTSGIIIHKIDSVTKEGIYGVTFLLYDENNNPIGQYESDQDGFVYIGMGLADGKYKIRELEPASGYDGDDMVRTIYLEYGRTTEIEWTNVAQKGQIIVTKRSAQYNEVTGLPAGSPLSGAVFEVYSTAGNLVDKMVSDAKGVAASKPIPLGVYFVKEVSPPKYYALNPREFFAELKHNGDIVRFELLDENVSLGLTIQKKSQSQATPGQTIYYDLFNIANTGSSALESFYVHDRLPTDAVRGNKVFTGTWSDRLTYRVTYKTNYSGDYRELASGLSTKTSYELSIHPNVLGLANGEYVTDIRWEFGTVPAGFKCVENPKLMVQVLPTLPKDYKIVNRADVGGLYIGEWETAQTSCLTTVIGGYNPPALPKTGY